MQLKIGQKIKILDMYNDTSYNNRVGIITRFGELGEENLCSLMLIYSFL